MEELENLRRGAVELVCVATDGNSLFMERISGAETISVDLLINGLREAKVPLGEILLEDIKNLFAGEPLRYFVSEETLVERYQDRYGFQPIQEEAKGLRKVNSQVAFDWLAESKRELEHYGVTLDEFRAGTACFNERDFFYATDEWKDRSKVGQLIDHWRCKVCGRDGLKLHTHHHGPIYSVYSRQFRKNFEPGRLKALCEDCHQQFHATHVRGCGDFTPAGVYGKERERLYFQNVKQAHDEMRICEYCFRDNLN